MLNPKDEPLLREIAQEWNKAENSIKIAEQIDNEVVNPAIYELRYAGRKLIESIELCASNPELVSAKLSDAKFDCHRSRHDAIDAATNKMIGDLSGALKELGPDIVLTHFPDFSKLFSPLQIVRSKIAISREDRNNRDAIYDTIEEADLQKSGLLDLFDQFRASEPLMKASADKAQKQQEELRRASAEAVKRQEDLEQKLEASSRREKISWAIGLFGLVIGLLGLFA